MPGVLIIEAMAQTAAAMVMHYLGMHDQEQLVYFMGIDEAKFRKMVGGSWRCIAFGCSKASATRPPPSGALKVKLMSMVSWLQKL